MPTCGNDDVVAKAVWVTVAPPVTVAAGKLVLRARMAWPTLIPMLAAPNEAATLNVAGVTEAAPPAFIVSAGVGSDVLTARVAGVTDEPPLAVPLKVALTAKVLGVTVAPLLTVTAPNAVLTARVVGVTLAGLVAVTVAPKVVALVRAT